MKRIRNTLAGLIAAASMVPAVAASRTADADLAPVRTATARYHQPAAARAAGYDLIPGLDHCFESPGVGAMGFHYIDAASLDLELDALRPEAMVYAPGPNGVLTLAAVEYIVPAADWDAAGHTEPPSVLDHSLHLNAALGVYVLHAWIWQHNPSIDKSE